MTESLQHKKFAVIGLTLALLTPGFAADLSAPVLAGVYSVYLSLAWTDASVTSVSSLRTEIEIKLQNTGIILATEQQQTVLHGPTLSIGIGSTVPASIVVEMSEQAYLNRDVAARGTHAALDRYFDWYQARSKDKTPLTPEEENEHFMPVYLEQQKNSLLPLPPAKMAVTWIRSGISASSHRETVQEIIARYAKHPYWETPAGRPIVQHMMDLEVHAAEVNREDSPLMSVHDAVIYFVDEFIREWSAANPRILQDGKKP